MYDESKRFAEAATMAYLRYHKVNTHIVRIFNTAAQGERWAGHSELHAAGAAGEGLTIYGDGSRRAASVT